MKYELTFYSDYNDDYTLKQIFDSEIDAQIFAENNSYSFDDIVIDEDGNDYYKMFYRYYNPENKENNYTGYTISQIKSN